MSNVGGTRSRAAICAVVVFALSATSAFGTQGLSGRELPGPKHGAIQPASPELVAGDSPQVAEVEASLARLRESGSVRHVRLDRRTGRVAALFGELGTVAPPVKGTPGEVESETVAFLAGNASLLGAADAAGELELERRVDAGAGSHLVFRQKAGALPVFDSGATVHVGADGRVYGVTSTFAPGLDPALAVSDPSIDEETARRVALDALSITSDALRDEDPFPAELGVAPVDGGRLAWRLVVPVREPFGQWELFVDAGSGALVGEPRSLVASAGRARVFVPNPIVSTGQTNLRDENNSDAAVPASAYIAVDLQGLDSSGFVTGTYCTTDRTPNRVRAADGDFTDLRRSNPGFNEVETYWAIDTAQRYIRETLGVENAAAYQIRVNTYAFADDNSNYTAFGDGRGVLNFGYGGVDDAQDAEIIWHEYGHAILDNQARLHFFGEAGAIHEGFGDYVAATMSMTVPGEARFYPTVGEWDATSYSSAQVPFLRRVNTGKRYPDDVRNQVHSDGEIWSSCLWALNGSLGRTTADRIIFNANFLFPRDATFADAAAAVLEADRQLNGGANANRVVAAFAEHGIRLEAAGPTVSSVRIKKARLVVDGSAFETGRAVVEVDGRALGQTKYPVKFRRKGQSRRIKSADPFVAQLEAGVAVEVTVLNPSTGARSAPFAFTP